MKYSDEKELAWHVAGNIIEPASLPCHIYPDPLFSTPIGVMS